MDAVGDILKTSQPNSTTQATSTHDAEDKTNRTNGCNTRTSGESAGGVASQAWVDICDDEMPAVTLPSRLSGTDDTSHSHDDARDVLAAEENPDIVDKLAFVPFDMDYLRTLDRVQLCNHVRSHTITPSEAHLHFLAHQYASLIEAEATLVSKSNYKQESKSTQSRSRHKRNRVRAEAPRRVRTGDLQPQA